MQVTTFRKTCIALAVLSCPTIFSPVFAGGGGLTGGAMEHTQMMNNAELIAQVGEAASTTANTLQSAMGIVDQLRQFNPATIAKMTGLPIKDVTAMANAYKTMSKAAVIYKDVAGMLNNHASAAQILKVGPQKFLEMKALLAKQEGGIHKQQYEQETAKLKQLQSIAGDVQEQATNLQRIDSTVGGVQFLASQNVKVQGLMVQLNDSVANANANAAQIAEAKKNQEAQDADNEKAYRDAVKDGQLKSFSAARIKQDRASDEKAKASFQDQIDQISREATAQPSAAQIRANRDSDARAKDSFQAQIDSWGKPETITPQEMQRRNEAALREMEADEAGKQPATVRANAGRENLAKQVQAWKEEERQKLEEERQKRNTDPIYAAQAAAKDATESARRAEAARQAAAAQKAATEKAIADHNWKLENDPEYAAVIKARNDKAAAAKAALEAKGVRFR